MYSLDSRSLPLSVNDFVCHSFTFLVLVSVRQTEVLVRELMIRHGGSWILLFLVLFVRTPPTTIVMQVLKKL